ncbi:LsmAD domain protein [Necator americanus]|uniref:LsmAD domain protein n=1 Tax=Necator americanus TaxID=51031 RepID=W2SYV4_NECAM|nr:LsmAD domain protein [Necator americanus]ETN73827.1 LsmAD domain protein [Necator americanus]
MYLLDLSNSDMNETELSYGVFFEQPFDIGLRHAYKITTGNSENLLPKREDMTAKMLFKFSDIVAMSALMNEEKVIRGFATDRDYHMKQQNGRLEGEEHELQEWSADEDGEEIEPLDQMVCSIVLTNNFELIISGKRVESEAMRKNLRREAFPDQRQRYQRNNGWNVEEMFNTNSQMGVQSTYEEDLRQYTTAPVEGSEEDRRRADQIAREIESSQQSKLNARLENDDDERDLDKVTTEDDFEMQNKRGSGGGQRGNFSNRNQRNGASGPPLGNRRTAEVVKGSQELLLEPRSSASPRGAPSDPKSQPGAAARRADGLRGWNQEFNNNYRPEGKVDTPRESPARPVPPAPSGNAWARGPPTSVTNAHNSSQQATPTPASPSHAVETSPQDPMPNSTHDQPADQSPATASSPRTEGSSPTVASAPASNTPTASHEATPDSVAASATTEKEEGTKKFTFNVNAPAFKPRSAQAQIQAQQVGPPPGGPPQAMMGAVPMVPAGVPIQTAMPPPGMLPTMQTGQPPVLVQWQGAPGQQYQVCVNC